MKNFNFKLIGVLFIALFCLSPICAADSNATDDTALGDQHYYADLSLSVNDVKKGEPIVIDVYTEDFISQGVNVFYERYFSFLWLDHGHGQLTLDSNDFTCGPHTIRVMSQTYESPVHQLRPAEATFNVYA